MPTPTKLLGLRIPVELHKRLKLLALMSDVSLSDLIRSLLEKYMEEKKPNEEEN